MMSIPLIFYTIVVANLLHSDAFSIHYRPMTLSRSSTALSMNLFDRFQRVAKANLNNILQNLEDPEKIMSQALEDMQVRSWYTWIRSSFGLLAPILSHWLYY